MEPPPFYRLESDQKPKQAFLKFCSYQMFDLAAISF